VQQIYFIIFAEHKHAMSAHWMLVHSFSPF
jgi:hypothetical protein